MKLIKYLVLPISKKIWESYLQKLEDESKNRPFQMSAKYVLNQISYIEETPNPVKDDQALARCMGRGWEKYYRKYMTANIRRDPRDGGESKQWNVTGFVVEAVADGRRQAKSKDDIADLVTLAQTGTAEQAEFARNRLDELRNKINEALAGAKTVSKAGIKVNVVK